MKNNSKCNFLNVYKVQNKKNETILTSNNILWDL